MWYTGSNTNDADCDHSRGAKDLLSTEDKSNNNSTSFSRAPFLDNSTHNAISLPPKVEEAEDFPGRWKRLLKIAALVIIGITTLALMSLLYRGTLMILEYREIFGENTPITLSPMHGVVSAFTSSTQLCSSYSSQPLLMDDLNYQFKTYRSDLNSRASNEPLRILIVGDSTARGVGIQDSCHPVMPEVLASVLSRHFHGRPVYWSAFGEPGATIKMIAQQILPSDRHSQSSSIQQFHALHRTLTGANKNVGDETTCQFDNICTRGYSLDQQEWIKRLNYHEKLYLENPFAGYDYIIALSGVNEVKRILLPFLILDEDGLDILVDVTEETIDTASKDRGFKADLKLFIGKLKQVANGHNEECSNDEYIHTVPHIIFPVMPVQHIPARMGFITRSIGVFSCGILDGLKRKTEAEDPEHVFAPPVASDGDTLDFIQRKGVLEEAINAEEDVKLRLVHVNGKACRNLVGEMQSFYSKHRASVESGMKMLALFAPDAIHPNDFGYDFYGRYLGLMIIDKWLANDKLRKKREVQG